MHYIFLDYPSMAQAIASFTAPFKVGQYRIFVIDGEKIKVTLTLNSSKLKNSHDGEGACTPLYVGFEYLGYSYRDIKYDIEVSMTDNSDDLDVRTHNSASTSFIYSFSRYTNTFGINVPYPDPNVDGVTLDLSFGSPPPQSLIGFTNLGATCYINSLLQTFRYMESFRKKLNSSNGYYSTLLRRLYNWCDASDGMIFTPSEFIYNLPFVNSIHEHQDVHEFSKKLIDKLEIESKELVRGVLEGVSVSVIESSCGCTSKREEIFTDMQLSIEKTDCGRSADNNVLSALNSITAPENIEGYTCEQHGSQPATKQIFYKELPEYVFILINRFVMDWEYMEYKKDNGKFVYPERIDFKDYILGDTNNDSAGINPGKDTVYSLFSVIVHSGSIDEGHFYSFVKVEDKFCKFNDASVNEASRGEVFDWNFGGRDEVNGKRKDYSAYYLVYKRIGKEDTGCSIDGGISINDTSGCDNFKVPVKYVDDSCITNYYGPGICNISDTAYCMTSYREEEIGIFDNIELFVNRKNNTSNLEVYYVRNGQCEDGGDKCNLIRVNDTSLYTLLQKNVISSRTPDIVPGAVSRTISNACFFVSPAYKSGKLVFLKIFQDDIVNCTAPISLKAIGSVRIKSIEELKEYSKYDEFGVYKENTSDEITEAINSLDGIGTGDILIISRVNPGSILKQIRNGMSLFVKINDRKYSLFIERSIVRNKELLEKKINEEYGRSDIRMVDDGMEFQADNCDVEGTIPIHNVSSAICPVSFSTYYVGVLNSRIDVNFIDHIHTYLLTNPKVDDIEYIYRTSKAECMKSNIMENIQIIHLYKKCLNIKFYNSGEYLLENGLIVIMKYIKNTINVAFFSYKNTNLVDNIDRSISSIINNTFSTCIDIINYPFVMENPRSIKRFREIYMCTSEIIRFDGLNYTVCQIDDEINDGEYLLIRSC